MAKKVKRKAPAALDDSWADEFEQQLKKTPAPRAAPKKVKEKEPKKKSGRPLSVIGVPLNDMNGVWLSVNTFCRETNRDRAYVAKRLLTVSDMNPQKGPTGQPLYRLGALIDLIYVRDAAGNVDMDKADPFRRKAHYAGELDKLNLQTKAGELIPRAVVEQRFATIFKVLAQYLDTLPDILERDCGLNTTHLKTVEERTDATRIELKKAIDLASEVEEKQNGTPVR